MTLLAFFFGIVTCDVARSLFAIYQFRRAFGTRCKICHRESTKAVCVRDLTSLDFDRLWPLCAWCAADVCVSIRADSLDVAPHNK